MKVICLKERRYRVMGGITQDARVSSQGKLVDEALDVAPIQRRQQIDLVTDTADRPRAEAQDRDRFPAPYLWSRRAHQQPIEATVTNRGQQDQSSGNRSAAARAADRGGDGLMAGDDLRVLAGGLDDQPPLGR
jgi:hypothetical protein